jgi:hypothetical protein
VSVVILALGLCTAGPLRAQPLDVIMQPHRVVHGAQPPVEAVPGRVAFHDVGLVHARVAGNVFRYAFAVFIHPDRLHKVPERLEDDVREAIDIQS